MALPIAPPMMRPMAAAASREVRRREPDSEREARGEGEQDQPEAPKRAFLRQEPVADALVPHQNEVEEGGERDGPLRADVVNIEHPRLVGLVEQDHDRGDRKPERRYRPP